MIERITGAPDGVVAFEAVGEVTAADYEHVLAPAVAAAIDHDGAVRMVYELGPRFDGYSMGAAWQDTKLGVGHLGKFERCAVVTDKDWVRHTVHAFAVLMPCPVRVYPVEELSDALDWAAGS